MPAPTQRDEPLCDVAPDGSRIRIVVDGVPSIQPGSKFVEQLVDAASSLFVEFGPFERLVRVSILYRWPMSRRERSTREPGIVAWRAATPSNPAILSSCLGALREGGLLGSTSYVCDTTTRKVAVAHPKLWVGGLVQLDEIDDLDEVAL